MEPISTEILVLGAGPGGYTAAFYAADRGKKVTLVEQNPRLGGVCMNVGCIPSKALLHATAVMRESKESSKRGIEFGAPNLDLDKLRAWKESIVEKLGQGIKTLAQHRNVEVMHGRGHFEDSQTLRVETDAGQKFINYEKAIIAVGSKPAMPNAFDLGNKRIMTSTEALEIQDIPQDLFVVGGGYIGMEFGTVYAALGSQVVVVEALASILTGADPDLVRPVSRVRAKGVQGNPPEHQSAQDGHRRQTNQSHHGDQQRAARRTLRPRPRERRARAESAPILDWKTPKSPKMTKVSFKCNAQQQTEDPNIYAIGDVAGGILLAHRAFKEAKIAVEAMLGEASAFENVVIPAVVFTDPEVAWCGLTETEAKQKNIEVKIAKFPWGASGRALTLDRPGRLDQTHYRSGDRAHPRRGHRRRRRRRTDRRRRSRGGNGRHRAGSSPIRCIRIRRYRRP